MTVSRVLGLPRCIYSRRKNDSDTHVLSLPELNCFGVEGRSKFEEEEYTDESKLMYQFE